MRVLVTGATGLLGNNLVRCLLERGAQVTVLVRGETRRSALDDVAVETVPGDLADAAAVQRAIKGVDRVIHAAAHLHIGWHQGAQAQAINVLGTRHVVQAALAAHVPMVHVSTVNTLAIGTPRAPADEQTCGDGQVPCSYILSKRAAETEVRAGIDQGLQAVLVHPGFLLGPWDWRPSSGRMLLEVARRRPAFYLTGGCSVSDARDVADGTLAAMEQGEAGRSYVLAGENWTYRRLWSEILQRCGGRAPFLPVGPLARRIAGTLGDLRSRLRGEEGETNSAAMKMSAQHHWYCSDRARRELEYSPRPVEQTLDDTIAWFRDRQMLAVRV